MAKVEEDIVVFWNGEFRLIPAKKWQGIKPLNSIVRDAAEKMVREGGILGNIPLTSDDMPGGYSVVVNMAAVLGQSQKIKG
jgi:hypothetical protein